MDVLMWILLFGVYLIIGKVIVTALHVRGYISDMAIDFFICFLYVFLPLTLFVVGVSSISDWIIKILKIK